MVKKKQALNQTVEGVRQALFPGMTLCIVHFNDGSETNDYVPDEVLHDPSQAAAEWWNEEKKYEYMSVLQGKRKAVSVTPIKVQ